VVGTSTLEKKNKDLNRATRELEAKMRNLQQRAENDKVTNHNIKYIRINCTLRHNRGCSRVVRGPDCQCQSRNSPGLGSFPASSDTEESEGWQMKQCGIKYYTKTLETFAARSKNVGEDISFFSEIRDVDASELRT
jgi:hypothetical protein